MSDLIKFILTNYKFEKGVEALKQLKSDLIKAIPADVVTLVKSNDQDDSVEILFEGEVCMIIDPDLEHAVIVERVFDNMCVSNKKIFIKHEIEIDSSNYGFRLTSGGRLIEFQSNKNSNLFDLYRGLGLTGPLLRINRYLNGMMVLKNEDY